MAYCCCITMYKLYISTTTVCVLFTYLTSELATDSIVRLLSGSSDVTLLLLGKKKIHNS